MRLVTAVGLAGIALAGVALAFAFEARDYNIIGALFVLAGLLLLNAPLLVLATRAEADPRIRRVIVLAFGLQLAACLARYYMVTDLYGRGDSLSYADWGVRLAESFRAGDFAVEMGSGSSGTHVIRYLTGLVFAVTGPTILGGYLVFSTISFWGLFGCYRAFKLTFPTGGHHRYAALVLLLPSLVFWPSSIGKEAWMLGSIGLASYGAARMFVRLRGGSMLFAAGTAAAAAVRPHLAAVLVAALFAGYLARARPQRPPLLGPTGQVVGVAIILVAGLLLVDGVAEHFGVEGETIGDTVSGVLEESERRTTQGGSEHEVAPVTSPADLPRGFVTVLFRPFPFEAHNVQSLVTSLEGLLLMGLVATSLPRLRGLGRLFVTNAYVRYAVVFTLLFILAWSNVGNFGILARQRTQMLPFVLVLLSLPLPALRAAAGMERSDGAGRSAR